MVLTTIFIFKCFFDFQINGFIYLCSKKAIMILIPSVSYNFTTHTLTDF